MEILFYLLALIGIIAGIAFGWDIIKNKKVYVALAIGFCFGISFGYFAKGYESDRYRDAATEYADQYELCKAELAKKNEMIMEAANKLKLSQYNALLSLFVDYLE